MSRYIDTKLVPALFDEEYKKTRELIYQGETHLDNLAEGFSEAARVIRTMPAADVVEVRHGKSISEMHYSDEFICSECGLIMSECCRYEIDEDADGDESCYGFEFKYCPNCGARMDGERSEK